MAMDETHTLCVIPVRLESKRFPGKVLAKISGRYMLEWVYRRAFLTGCDTVIATDNKIIAEVVESFGGNSVYTKTEHKNGTERVFEAYQKTAQIKRKNYELVINLQGDEPLILSESIAELIHKFDETKHEIFTPVSRKIINCPMHYDPYDTFLVKDQNDRAIYFSRYAIPFEVNQEYPQIKFRHIGIYAYRPKILEEIIGFSPSLTEIAESQEQNRWIEYGKQVYIFEINQDTPAVDSPDHITIIEEFLEHNPKYRL